MHVRQRLNTNFITTTTTPPPPRRYSHLDTRIGLTSDQLEYREVAAQFAATELKPYGAEWDAKHHYPVDALRKAAELGFGGIYCSDTYGGSALTRSDAVAVFEALATGCVSTAAWLSIHNMCAWMIDRYGNDELKSQYLPKLTSCEYLASYCLTEPNAGSDAANLQTKAVKKKSGGCGDGEDKWILNGTKAFISGGSVSNLYIVMARTGDANSGARGITAFFVPSNTPGLSFGAQEKKLGWHSQPTCSVILEDCEVPSSHILGELNQGFKIAMQGLDGGRLNIATTSIGGAIACLNTATDYVKQRKQFGVPLSSLQSIQFKLADMTTAVHTARLVIQNAARLLDEKHVDATQHCAMAKVYGTDTGFAVCNSALQLLGGYGYLDDYDIHRYVRDVRVHQILEGTNEIMRVIIGKHVIKD